MKFSQYKLYDRVYSTLAFDTVLETNSFLEKNPEFGVISKPDSDKIHVALLKDEGGTLTEPNPVQLKIEAALRKFDSSKIGMAVKNQLKKNVD